MEKDDDDLRVTHAKLVIGKSLKAILKLFKSETRVKIENFVFKKLVSVSHSLFWKSKLNNGLLLSESC